METATIKFCDNPSVCQVVDFTDGCTSVTWVGDELTIVGDADVIDRTIEMFCCEGFL